MSILRASYTYATSTILGVCILAYVNRLSESEAGAVIVGSFCYMAIKGVLVFIDIVSETNETAYDVIAFLLGVTAIVGFTQFSQYNLVNNPGLAVGVTVIVASFVTTGTVSFLIGALFAALSKK